ncbi:MAG: hypothetical protein BGO01_03740 [Armatimonadetes bacterium 55-13]|nr:hypothetical protein [Armatimonadota bacterium]OJU63059.1 MAG: hypothetical protein BGO01_03740 [Armatimonadetes bacterium 55-13]
MEPVSLAVIITEAIKYLLFVVVPALVVWIWRTQSRVQTLEARLVNAENENKRLETQLHKQDGEVQALITAHNSMMVTLARIETHLQVLIEAHKK